MNRFRKDYLSDYFGDSIRQNPKAFWLHIKELAEGRRTQITKISKLEMTEVFTELSAKAEVLNSQFSVFLTKKKPRISQSLAKALYRLLEQ